MNKAVGTPGYQIGSSIIGKDNSPTTKAAVATGGNDPADFDRITIRGHENGVTVEHEPKTAPGKESPYSPGKTHAFNNMGEAHAHVGKLMGLGGAAGKKSAGSF